MAEHIIELKNVVKYYDDTLVIDNVSFYVNKGEFITFLGPSGCGLRPPHERANFAQRQGYFPAPPQQAPR